MQRAAEGCPRVPPTAPLGNLGPTSSLCTWRDGSPGTGPGGAPASPTAELSTAAHHTAHRGLAGTLEPEFPNQPTRGPACRYGSAGGQQAGLLEPRNPERCCRTSHPLCLLVGLRPVQGQRLLAAEGGGQGGLVVQSASSSLTVGKEHGGLQGGVDPHGPAGPRMWTRLPCLPPGQ